MISTPSSPLIVRRWYSRRTGETSTTRLTATSDVCNPPYTAASASSQSAAAVLFAASSRSVTGDGGATDEQAETRSAERTGTVRVNIRI
jgi:hypothetical protein